MAAAPSIRWYRVTPDRFVAGLVLAECLFWLSERYRWFPINQHKGWTVLIAAAFLAAMVLVMLLWFATALVFRLRFQFTIRSMLVFTVVVAMQCGWLAVEVGAAKRQKQKVDSICNNRLGIAQYDWDHASTTSAASHGPPGPKWLRERLGDDFFAEIDFVVLQGISDSSLEKLGISSEFPALRYMGVCDSEQLTNAGLKFLPSTNTIKTLILVDAQFTNDGLKRLEEYPQLQELNLQGTGISDSGVERVKVLKKLRVLTLGDDSITDAAIENLSDMPELRELYLGSNSITNAGLARLSQMVKLRVLGVGSTKITDAGIKDFLRMTQLQKLDITNTKISPSGLATLRSGLPNCVITK